MFSLIFQGFIDEMSSISNIDVENCVTNCSTIEEFIEKLSSESFHNDLNAIHNHNPGENGENNPIGFIFRDLEDIDPKLTPVDESPTTTSSESSTVKSSTSPASSTSSISHGQNKQLLVRKHQLKVLCDEFPLQERCASHLLNKYIELESLHGENVRDCRRKDAIRGERVIFDYNLTHTDADLDSVVIDTLKAVEKNTAKAKLFLVEK